MTRTGRHKMHLDVSVVMGVHNDAAYLRQAIESILCQEGVSLEFIIVNDGSTDGSAEILEEWARKDNRIKLIHQENAGLTKALVRGCDEASGEFIARQDADDVSLPGRLQRQLKMLRSENLAFCSTWVRQVGPNGEFMGHVEVPESTTDLTESLRERFWGVPCHGSVMMRRDSYQQAGGYRPEFYYAQDADLWNRLVDVRDYGCVAEPLYQLRIAPGSISGAYRDIQSKFHSLAIECAKRRRAGKGETPILDAARELCEVARTARATSQKHQSHRAALSLYMIGTTLMRQGNPACRRYFRDAIRQRPLYMKAWGRYAMSLVRLQ